jgi:ubiquinone/menaquinone biosynthesis C-methylase UbiE/uncharacterized protein YbaR (Trm112 family)
MKEQIGELLVCPICEGSLVFAGKRTHDRFVRGHFRCGNGHLYQVKDEIGLLKDAKVSADEFEWRVDVADEKRYEEVRRQYDSFLREDQRDANRRMMERLGSLTAKSCERSGLVLDIATGMGTFILPLLQESIGNFQVVGTDIDEKPLRGLLNKASRAGVYDRLSLIVTDAKHLAFKSNAIYTISSFFGFDNVPHTTSALKESGRVLHRGGSVFFSSIWYKEGSESMRLAEKHEVCEIASEARLEKALKEAGLVLESLEEVYSGLWPHNPMDLLPVEGDEYAHVLVQAKKPVR